MAKRQPAVKMVDYQPGILNTIFKQYMAQNHPKTWPNSYFWKQVQNDWNNALESAAQLEELTPGNIRKLKSSVTITRSKSRPKTFEHVPIDPNVFFSKIDDQQIEMLNSDG